MAGVSLEERADAGTPPVGDQNAARVFFDRATLNSAIGGSAVIVGEGFRPGETVTISGCAVGSLGSAGPDGQAELFLPILRARESHRVSSQVGPAAGGTGNYPSAPGRNKPSGPYLPPAFVTSAPLDKVPIAGVKAAAK